MTATVTKRCTPVSADRWRLPPPVYISHRAYWTILRRRKYRFHTVTLHVGIDTFRPLTEDEAAGDRLHGEYCHVPEETADAVKKCHTRGGRVFAVGTTTARALESASATGTIEPFEGWTAIFIKPPYRFKSVDALVTNFHLPRSSLLMMVSAFAGRERILWTYEEAVRRGYRFYSYGDAMLILGEQRCM